MASASTSNLGWFTAILLFTLSCSIPTSTGQSPVRILFLLLILSLSVMSLGVGVTEYEKMIEFPLHVATIEAYDPLDPNWNITIKWDVMSWTADGYVVRTRYHVPILSRI